jgi:hypothetical protein
MRLAIIRPLVHKELLRHLSNRGSVVLALLMVAVVLVLSVFGGGGPFPGLNLLQPPSTCTIEFPAEDAWVRYLRGHVPGDLAGRVAFRETPARPADTEAAPGLETNALVVRIGPAQKGGREVQARRTGSDPKAVAVFEGWLTQESQRFFRSRAAEVLAAHGGELPPEPAAADELSGWEAAHRSFRTQVTERLRPLGPEAVAAGTPPELAVRESVGPSGIELRNVLASALVLFALFFTCVYLLPSLTCEERERGVLLAQALSPASPWEIIAAKLVFYPLAGMLFGAMLAGLYRPDALLRPTFWLALTALAGGSLGVGLTIASLARTQRAASLGALCYMLVVSLVILVCQQHVPALRFFFLEYHGPQMLNAVLTGGSYSLGHLVGALALAGLWLGTAAFAFRRYGWQ